MKDSAWKLRRLTVMAMLTAISYAAVFFFRIPVVLFLNYEPKDVLLTIGAFLFGPLTGAIMAVVVALLEMVTFSTTGAIGLAMNIISSCLFVCTASLIYHRKRTLSGAVIGLICGALLTTIGMVLWNYLITPLYMSVSRADVVSMLLPVFAPFNLLKGAINATLAMLLYKPLSSALRSARLLPPTEMSGKKARIPVWLIALFVLTTLVLILLSWKGVI